jgi:hypothetical protein
VSRTRSSTDRRDRAGERAAAPALRGQARPRTTDADHRQHQRLDQPRPLEEVRRRLLQLAEGRQERHVRDRVLRGVDEEDAPPRQGRQRPGDAGVEVARRRPRPLRRRGRRVAMSTIDLEKITLDSGGHGAGQADRTAADLAMCVNEAVAYSTGEPWSDRAAVCVAALIRRFTDQSQRQRSVDDDRQLLKPYIPRLVGTNTGKEDERSRRWMCVTGSCTSTRRRGSVRLG